MKLGSKCKNFHSQKCIWKCHCEIAAILSNESWVNCCHDWRCSRTKRVLGHYWFNCTANSNDQNPPPDAVALEVSALEVPAGLVVALLWPDTHFWWYPLITQWGWDKMVAISQMTSAFKRFFLNENIRMSIKISLKFVPKIRINNITSLVRIMAWHRPGDKPLSKTMMISLLTHICVTLPQWVKVYQPFSMLRKLEIMSLQLAMCLHMARH